MFSYISKYQNGHKVMQKELILLKALSDQNRLRIVAGLFRFDELCACQVTELLEVAGPTVSRHLSVLSQAGVLNSRKSGRWIFYRLSESFSASLVAGWINTTVLDSDQALADQAQLKQITARGPEEICRKQRGETCCPKN